jgi:hypothetical protein
MNPIKQILSEILSGLCSSLLLSINCDGEASLMMFLGGSPDSGAGNLSRDVAPTCFCEPCSFTES